MNRQRAQHMSAPLPVVPGLQNDSGDADPNAGIGSSQSGYATPDNGPFECANCIHFKDPNQCDNPQVVSDPEVNGQVDPEGCCNLFSPAGKESEGEEQDEIGETGAIPGAGEGGQ